MDVIETLLKLPESERQKLAEALLLLRNVGANVSSNDSVGKSGTDSISSLNLSNNTPEKPVSKQKTLDNWIVKNKTPSLNSEKEQTNSKDIVSLVEAGESSRNFDSGEVSSTLPDHQLPCCSSAPIEKSSKLENVNKKKLMVLLNRKDCVESKHKSPEHSEFLFEKKSSSFIEIKSPGRNAHVSENSDKRTLSPEKNSPIPPRSYNLRSARGVSDEKQSSEASNSLVILPESENRDKIHRSVTKQKSKSKNFVGKDASPNSSTCLIEVKYDQKTDSCTNAISKQNTKTPEDKTSSTIVDSELEKTSEVISVDNNKIIITDENLVPVELGATLIVKGKRKRASKSKESKKLCFANSVQKSSPEEIELNRKSAESLQSKKVIKLNAINENPSELSIEKTVQLPGIDDSISPNQNKISTNDTIKSVSKLKLKSTAKKKDKNGLILCKNVKLDSTITKIKKKNLLSPEIDSSITKDVIFQNEISGKQLKFTTTSESHSKECAKAIEEFFTKDIDSKIISRKRGNENKTMKKGKDSLLSDSEMASKINNENSTETTSKIFLSLSKESSDEIEEPLTKDTSSRTLVNVDSKKLSRKRGSENKRMKTAKKSLLPNSEQVSKNTDKDRIPSIETSSKISPQNNKFAKETEESLIKDTNTVSSKKKCRKTGSENKSMVDAKNSLSHDLGQVSKNGDVDSITSTETLAVDSSKKSTSQNKECSKETEELLIKETSTVTSENVAPKRTSRKKGIGNKIVITKKCSKSDLEHASKSSDKNTIETLSEISPSINNEFAKETEELLINDTSTVSSKTVNSKRKYRKTGYENKNMVSAKNRSLSDSGQTSKNDNGDSMISTETLAVDSLKNSSSQKKECSKETEELLIKDTNPVTSENVGPKRRSRKRGIGNKSTLTTKNSLIYDSEQVSKSSKKDSITSIENLSTDLSKNSPPYCAKELSSNISSINNTPTTEKRTLSESVILDSQSSDHSRKNLPNNSDDELNSLNKMEESSKDHSKKSRAVSSNVSKSNSNNILLLQGNSNVSGVSRKKLKVAKDENQSNLPQSISNILDSEIEISSLNLKKDGSKKKLTFKKLKNVTDSNEEHSDVLITKSKASSSNSNAVKESQDQIIKNLKSNNELTQGQKEKMRVKTSKKVKQSPFKKKSSSVESQIVSPENEEKLNCSLKEESSVKNKLYKTKTNKKAPIKSNNKEKIMKEAKHGSSSQETTEKEHLLEKISVVQMDLDSLHSVEKSETCNNSTNSDNSADTEKVQEIIPDISVDINDSLESEKEKHNVIRDMGGITEKITDLTVDNSNDTGAVQTDLKNSTEFDVKMKNNYLAFCKVKEVLEAIGISIEEVFENPELINSLNSVSSDGAIKISKCKSESKILFVYMNQKKK
ncbi:unnamed protein product [Larinioides sclopetarius]|uniref:Uncharacterized protein n=1 Tax=Larinioides sclopetarius TaxID=280406 RepID=A0AAV2BHD0_9ARAC